MRGLQVVFEAEGSLDLMELCESVREWMYIAEIMIHHPCFRIGISTHPKRFPSQMSEHTMISDQVRFVFSYQKKQSSCLGVIEKSKKHPEVFHDFPSYAAREIAAEDLHFVAHGFQD
jgi:hypothetical protein